MSDTINDDVKYLQAKLPWDIVSVRIFCTEIHSLLKGRYEKLNKKRLKRTFIARIVL